MQNRPLFVIMAILLLVSSCTKKREMPLYKDPGVPVEKRVDDLLSRMTIEEKFWQLFMIPGNLEDDMSRYSHGIFGFQVSASVRKDDASGQLLDYSGSGAALATATEINAIQRYFVEETRLGIPIIPFDEALHGLVREGATLFPQSIGLAATFDTALMGRVAAAIAEETGSRGIRQVLSPVVNIARDVRWGRTEETYGEDPFLVSAMGVAFVSQFERRGIITTPKHFVANVGEGGRDSYPVHFSERLMEEIYFPAFRAVIKDGGSRSVMTSYNSYDGTPCSANPWLLREKLKEEWDFNGFVISDAGATGGANVLHFTASDYPGATTRAVTGGQDVLFQTSYDHYSLFLPAFLDGSIPGELIDDAVRRVLRAKFELGLFENPYADPETAIALNGSRAHLETALEAAARSMVLLENRNNTLPLSKELRRVAVIGTDAEEARPGGYSGPGVRRVSILEGLIREAGEGTSFIYSEGAGRYSETHVTVPAEYLSHYRDGKKEEGLVGTYFDNNSLSGEPVLVREEGQVDFRWTLFSPDPLLAYDWYSARWTGTITAPADGPLSIGLEGNDGYRLIIDGDTLIDNWIKRSYSFRSADLMVKKGTQHDIVIEFYESTGNARLKLLWNFGTDNRVTERIAEAVRNASRSDLAIVVAGIEEGEFRDRASLALPGRQDEMIRQVAATGVPVVVVLVGGSAVNTGSWSDYADAILLAWYPGDMGGEAVAGTLFGRYNPAGRLPVTWPVDEAQLPLYYNHKPTGRGDDYLNLTGHPRYPFGYGLSYTSFEYSELTVTGGDVRGGGRAIISCKVKNSGQLPGDEVIQLYLRDEVASVARPLMELKGFSRVALAPGESKMVIFDIGKEELELLNEQMERIVEPGPVRVMIGSSSRDIRLRGHIDIK